MKYTAHNSLFRQFINRLILPILITITLAMAANVIIGYNVARIEQKQHLQFLGAKHSLNPYGIVTIQQLKPL